MGSGSDVVIVGGGPAGITTALSLLREAPELRERVVVLEKATYPREKYCAGAVGGRGERILRALDAVPDVPSAPISGMSLAVVEGRVQVGVGRRIGRVIRRIEYDHALARFAMERGIRVLDGTRVEAVRHREGGAVVESTAGTFEARVVAGADGVGSVVRRAMGLSRGELRAQVLELDTEHVVDDTGRETLHFDASDRRFSGYYWDFPTVVDGRPMVCRGIYHLKVDDHPVDIRALFAEWLDRRGLSIDDFRNKRFAERGWVRDGHLADGALMLVGEAAGIDPVTGEGIAQAIEYGWMAGRFVARVVRGARPVSDWTGVVARSRLARDLSIRTRFVTGFYGPDRPRMERFLLRTPSAIHVGCQHFAHQPYSKTHLARVAVRGAATLAAARLGARG